MSRRIVPLLILATLAACAPDAPAVPEGGTAPAPAEAAAPVAAPALAVEAEGLRLFDPASGSARPLPFGTGRAQAMAALASRGAAETGTNADCGAGPLAYARWPDGLTLWFQDERFAGWALSPRPDTAPRPDSAPPSAPARGVSTASGLTIGSTRADLDSAYAGTVTQSTLGTEFAAGELYGLLDGEGSGAKVTALWAGVSCNFR